MSGCRSFGMWAIEDRTTPKVVIGIGQYARAKGTEGLFDKHLHSV